MEKWEIYVFFIYLLIFFFLLVILSVLMADIIFERNKTMIMVSDLFKSEFASLIIYLQID